MTHTEMIEVENRSAPSEITPAERARPSARTDEQIAREPLFNSNEAEVLRSEWRRIQASFVDAPEQSVREADELVARAIKRLSENFSGERSRMEHDWSQGQEVGTEDFRQALRRYRSFFERLLSV